MVVVVDRTCIIGHRNLPYKANLKRSYKNLSHQRKENIGSVIIKLILVAAPAREMTGISLMEIFMLDGA